MSNVAEIGLISNVSKLLDAFSVSVSLRSLSTSFTWPARAKCSELSRQLAENGAELPMSEVENLLRMVGNVKQTSSSSSSSGSSSSGGSSDGKKRKESHGRWDEDRERDPKRKSARDELSEYSQMKDTVGTSSGSSGPVISRILANEICLHRGLGEQSVDGQG